MNHGIVFIANVDHKASSSIADDIPSQHLSFCSVRRRGGPAGGSVLLNGGVLVGLLSGDLVHHPDGPEHALRLRLPRRGTQLHRMHSLLNCPGVSVIVPCLLLVRGGRLLEKQKRSHPPNHQGRRRQSTGAG
jgi:hypothetical protein